jgi:hypothetical protein
MKKRQSRGSDGDHKEGRGDSSSGEATNNDGEHALLTRGLSAGRQGFSVEELEKERAQKRAKTTTESPDP